MRGFALALLALVAASTAADDRHLNPTSAANGGLQKAWDSLPPGSTLWLAPGEFAGLTLVIVPHQDTKPRTLRGEIIDGRRATITGRFDREQPERSMEPAIKVMEGSSHWMIRDLDFRDVSSAIHARGNNDEISVEGLNVTGSREAIRLEGRGRAAAGSQKIRVADCRFDSFTKSGLRLCPGNRDVRIERCTADAGGRAWMKQKFHLAFFVEGECDEIYFSDCEARRAFDDAGKEYWNADGFCVEQAGHVRWERCRAFDCTDGGWDSKAARNELIDCFAARNKRNYRFWGSATLTNCLSTHPIFPGGRGGPAGLWTRAAVTATRCTFIAAAPFDIDTGGHLLLQKSLIIQLLKKQPITASEKIALEACRELSTTGEDLRKWFANPAIDSEDAAGFNPLPADFTEGFRASRSPQKP